VSETQTPWYRGLLDGWNEFVAPTQASIPANVLYDPETLRMARASLLMNFGTNLVAASQRGLSPEARASAISNIGQAPNAFTATLRSGDQAALVRAQVAKAREDAASEQAWRRMMMGEGGMPSAPAAPTVASVGAAPVGGADYTTAVVAGENNPASPNYRPDARNPRSSATGDGQFIDTTWLATIRTHRPDLATGKTDAEILALRADPVLSRQMIVAHAGDNARALRNVNLPANATNLALSHRLGAAGAARVLQADPNTPLDQLFGQDVMTANPDMVGRTAGQIVQGFQQRFASIASPTSGQSAPPAPAQGGGSPQDILRNLTPQQRMLLSMQPRAAGSRLLLEESLRRETYQPLPPDVARQQLGAAYDPNTLYQRNSRTGQITAVQGRETFAPVAPDQLPPEVRSGLGPRDIVQRGSSGRLFIDRGEQRFEVLQPDEAARVAGQGFDPRRTYLRSSTGNVTVIDPISQDGTTTAMREFAVRRVNRFRDSADASASNLRPRLEYLQQLLDSGEVSTGRLQSAILPVNQWLASLGFLPAESVSRVGAAESYRAVIRAIQPGMRAEGSGSTSDRDMVVFEQALPSLANTRWGNQIISATMLQLINREQQRAVLAEDYFARNGNLRGFDAFAERELGQSFPRVTVQDGERQREARTAEEFTAATQNMRPGTVVRLPDTPETRRMNGYPFYIVPQRAL